MRNDDVELVWRGPFASLPRPMDAGMVRSLAAAAGTTAAVAGLAILPFLFGWTDVPGANRAGLAVVFGFTVLGTVLQFTLRSVSPHVMESLHPNTIVGLFFGASVAVAAAVVFAGPTLGSIAVFTVAIPLLAFFALRVKWAVAVTLFSIVAYGCALSLLDDPPAPAQQVINVVASSGAAGVLIGGLASRLDRARSELAGLNRRFRRFLAPQVAAVIADESALAPHRGEIASFFVDLRGFTHFTNTVDPERVVEVLAEYYAAVGTRVDSYGGTLGGFDGDGVFAFLGDPVPNDNAAADAMAMAVAIASRLDGLTPTWSSDGHSLGYGIGLAFGTATIGLVGFEGRLDYTPLGAVVNLAARLCADAKHGEIVIDDALRVAAGVAEVTRRADVDLKGFGEVSTYVVSR